MAEWNRCMCDIRLLGDEAVGGTMQVHRWLRVARNLNYSQRGEYLMVPWRQEAVIMFGKFCADSCQYYSVVHKKEAFLGYSYSIEPCKPPAKWAFCNGNQELYNHQVSPQCVSLILRSRQQPSKTFMLSCRVTTRAFMFARRRWWALQRTCANSILNHSSSSLSLFSASDLRRSPNMMLALPYSSPSLEALRNDPYKLTITSSG